MVERARIEAAHVPRQAKKAASQYRGVRIRRHTSKRTGEVRVSCTPTITLNGQKHFNIGTFTIEEYGSLEAAELAAACAYDARAREVRRNKRERGSDPCFVRDSNRLDGLDGRRRSHS